MQPFLIFGLTASLGAMGELAGHERRGALSWPGRSAVIGLMGAALGIRRDGDFSALHALAITLGIFDDGTPLRDYHTIETVPSAAAKSPNSRPEALLVASGRTNTTITLRDYRTGPLYGVAVGGAGLPAIAAALNAPGFTLYLGRKSCPLAAPPGARVVQAASPADALAQMVVPPWRSEGPHAVRLCWLIEDDPQGEVIHDLPLDRIRWHFGPRRVSRVPVGAGDVT